LQYLTVIWSYFRNHCFLHVTWSSFRDFIQCGGDHFYHLLVSIIQTLLSLL